MVHRNLRRLGFDTLYLHELGVVRHARRAIGVLKPVFPRYVFVGIEPGRWLSQGDAMIGISSFVRTADGPLKVPPEVMAEWAAKADENGRLPTPVINGRPVLAKGSRWRISDHPLEGFLAVVEADAGEKVRAWVNLFGRKTRAEFEPEQLEPVSERRRR